MRGTIADELYGDIPSNPHEDDGPELVRLSEDDAGGLGGTSEEVFGELVSTDLRDRPPTPPPPSPGCPSFF